ncbi:hypothetical protein BN59_02533 [Legionella massiliensis]|uniref:Uncharacterized protein n=1 Tax=Legionella massiliensis TaxID=1034943 RepID=A0A078KUU5_9GAMM|nr:hypothetical protein [Legionella massiliensis]CDZ78225.1 hypothetical protein BN59_02533 [Legionella massiliensis]CEE13963.1 hypothetical protein BN1094_02533 [Legionella massiliensis]
MSIPAQQANKNIPIDLIKKRMLEKIDALFQLGLANQDKHSEKNLRTLYSVINQDNHDVDINELKQRMGQAINDLDLTQYNINEESGYKEGVLACIQALKEIGIATENWNLGTNNIQDVLLSAGNKLKADLERVLKAERANLLEQLKNKDLEYQEIPQDYRENDSFIIELVELELKLKHEGILQQEIDENDFVLIHPFHLLDEHFSSRSEQAQNRILELLGTMPRLTMRQLANPSKTLQRTMEEYDLSLNQSIALYTAQYDTNALESLPQEFERNEIILEAAVRNNPAQLKFVPEDMKQKLIDKIGAENLLSSNILAYKFFPKNDSNTQAINSYFSKIENIVVNTSFNDAELRDVALVYGNKEKRKGRTAFVGFSYSVTTTIVSEAESQEILTELDELVIAMKAANNQKDLHLALAAHSNTGGKENIGHLRHNDIAELCKRHGEIRQINLLTCSAAGTQNIPDEEQKMISELRKKESEIKKYIFARKLPGQSEKTFRDYYRALCEKNNIDGVYLLVENKETIPKYQLHVMKLVNEELLSKTVDIPANKEKFIQRFEVMYNDKVKNNGGKLISLSLAELIELRSATAEQHRFDPNHPKFKKDKKRFPLLAKFEIQEQDLKESKMKSLAKSLKEKNISQEISIQAYPGFMEVDTETNYLRAVKGHTFHLDSYKKSLYGTGQSGVDRVKALTQQKSIISALAQSEVSSSQAKKLKVTLRPDSVATMGQENTPPQIPLIDSHELTELKGSSDKCPELIALEKAVSKQLNDIIKSIESSKENSGDLAKEKARIIGGFLKTLSNATTVEEYCNTITNFRQSPKYRAINPPRNTYQVLGWMGETEGSLISDLHHAAVQHIQSKSSNTPSTLM